MVDMVRLFPRAKSEFRYWVFRLTIIAVIEIVLVLCIVAFAFLLAFKLIDFTLIVSLWVAEVPIAGFLWLLLGERAKSLREQTHDALERYHAIVEFKHIQVHTVKGDFGDWDRYDYPALRYFVLNTKSKEAYHAPDYIHDLERGGIIQRTIHDTLLDLQDEFKDTGIKIVEREPSPGELLWAK